MKNISSSKSSTVDLSVISKNKPVTKIVGIIFMGLSFAVTLMPAAMAETFSIDGMALNTNSQFPLKDGHPIMSTWKLNFNDNDQQFDRQGQLLRHRSTGKCLNAALPSVGSIVNVWPCNNNDGDQKFDIVSPAGTSAILIRRAGTTLCLDMDSRNSNTRMKLWNCMLDNPNQRFTSTYSDNSQQLRDQAARDQAARDQAARDQAARDQAARDQAARDQAARGQRDSQRKINDFVNQWNGKKGITRYDLGGSGYNGQCVTLVARYLQDHYGASKTGLSISNGGQTARTVGTNFPSFIWNTNADPMPGSIVSFPSLGVINGIRYGHVALVVSAQRNGTNLNMQILDSNGDGAGPNSVVRLRNITVNTRSWTAPGYGSILYSNPRD